MPDFAVSPVTRNHLTAVGKGIWHSGQVPSARGTVENEDHFKDQIWSLSSLVRQGKANANISHLGSDLILPRANTSNGLGGRLERKSLRRHPEQGG